jgi:hypothetical protein
MASGGVPPEDDPGDASGDPHADAPGRFRLETTTDPLRRKLSQARQEGTLTDFRLVVNGADIPCHKIILSLQADYFSRLLQYENTVEAAEGAVRLEELELEAVKLVVEYMYSGAVEFDLSMAQGIFEVIDRFQLSDDTLKEALSDYIIPHLCVSTCLGWRKFAEQMNLENVAAAALSIVVDRLIDVSQRSEFASLSFEDMANFLGKAKTRHYNHDRCLQAFVTWVMVDVSKRRQRFADIASIIDLKKCSVHILKDIYDDHGTVLLYDLDLLNTFTSAMSRGITAPRESQFDVIVSGGMLKSKFRMLNTENNLTWMLNLQSGSCIEKASQPNAKLYSFMCGTTDGLICAGGMDAGHNFSTDCVLYHKETDAWVDLPALPFATSGAGATCVLGALLMVVGGVGHRKKKAHILDLRTRKWTSCADMLHGLMNPIVGAVGDSVYVIFSTNSWNAKDRIGDEISVQCYNTTTRTWSFKSPLPDSITGTVGTTIVALSGRLYLVGGSGPVCARYDPEGDTWTVLSPPQHTHWYGAAMLLDGKIVLSGGKIEEKNQYQNIIEEYDPASDTWRVLSVKLPKPLYHHCMIQG